MKPHAISFFLLLTGIIHLPGFTTPVNLETAKQVCWNYNEMNNIVSLTHFDEIHLAHIVNHNQSRNPAYYVFNLSDQGFMIISGDDIFPPVLGFSNDHTFDLENSSPAFRQMLADYKSQMELFLGYPGNPTEEVSAAWHQILNNPESDGPLIIVSPLISCSWGQSPNYNAHCPADPQNISGHALAGCVAVALAQIMYYWNFPTSGKGSHSYSCENMSGDVEYGLLSANFGESKYRYEKMSDRLHSGSSQETLNAVAKLIYHCGVATQTTYGTYSSGASSLGANHHSAEYALRNYFKFGEVLGLYRADYEDSEWITLLKKEILEGKPVYYAGVSESGAGHAFLCDGYTSTDFFHINWGWSGNNNGYFLISALISGTTHYVNHHRIITQIYPSNLLISDVDTIVIPASNDSYSNIHSVNIESEQIWNPIQVQTESPFQISVDAENWGERCTLPPVGGRIFVRSTPTTSETISKNLTFTAANTIPCSVFLHKTSTASNSSFPWFEGFESGTIPASWEIVNTNTATGWQLHHGDRRSSTYPHSGNYNLYFFDTPRIIPSKSRLTFDAFDLTMITNPKLSFALMKANWAIDVDTLNIYYNHGENSNWILLKNYHQSIDDWILDTLLLPSPSANYRLAFEAVSKYAYGVCLDDISIWGESSRFHIRCSHTNGGVLSFPAESSYQAGDSITLLITPDPNYMIRKIIVNNQIIPPSNRITFDSIHENMTVFVLFEYMGDSEICISDEPLHFQCEIGNHSESKKLLIRGERLSDFIHITAPPHFEVFDVDQWEQTTTLSCFGGELQLRYNPEYIGNYSDTLILRSGNTIRKITLSGYAAPQDFKIKITTTEGGTTSLPGIYIAQWNQQIPLTIYPQYQYMIDSIFINNEYAGYRDFLNITVREDKNIYIKFKETTYPVVYSSSQDLFFEITSSTMTTKQEVPYYIENFQHNIMLTVTPPFYIIKNGVLMEQLYAERAIDTIEIVYIPENENIHTGQLLFGIYQYPLKEINLSGEYRTERFKINSECSDGGTIFPQGIFTYRHNESATYYFSPNENYEIEYILVDGYYENIETSYTFSDIAKNHVIYVQFTLKSGISERGHQEFSIFPNPAQDMIYLKCTTENTEKIQYSIYDIYGRILRTGESTSGLFHLSVSDFSSGVYIFKIVQNQSVYTKQFIKE